ncbi:hypothetical protein DRJ25_00175 [Candidatus Woesearchaeota archaeon]|nr:MAG: hypothetical protein DRJ25_00175 [Candidatus Woesearchaeota archaeon]
MEIEIDLTKSLEKNAEDYYNKAKKIKSKIEKAKAVLEKFRKKIEALEKKKEKEEKRKEQKLKSKRKEEWFEKFRWFYSSEGFLCIGGRDATTNDILIKKHLEKGDLVCHTDLPGSPFFIIKAEGRTVGKATKEEAAIATASYSRAWKLGMSYAKVYIVRHDQIKKELGLPKGMFMIYGKREYFTPALELGVCLLETGLIMGGPISAVEAHSKEYVIIKQGKKKASDIAKEIAKKLKITGRADDIIRVLPPGGSQVVRFVKKR